MFDLLKAKAPDTIEVEGVFYDIKTELRDWLRFSRTLKNEDALLSDFDFIYVDKIPQDRQKGFSALIEFYNPPRELPRKVGKSNNNTIMLDYDLDAPLIYSAFMELYGIDLLATDNKGKLIPIHWHKFLALLEGVHGTKLNDIMGYRAYNPNDRTKYEKQMSDLKKAWEIIPPESKKSREQREKFNSLFKK